MSAISLNSIETTSASLLPEPCISCAASFTQICSRSSEGIWKVASAITGSNAGAGPISFISRMNDMKLAFSKQPFVHIKIAACTFCGKEWCTRTGIADGIAASWGASMLCSTNAAAVASGLVGSDTKMLDASVLAVSMMSSSLCSTMPASWPVLSALKIRFTRSARTLFDSLAGKHIGGIWVTHCRVSLTMVSLKPFSVKMSLCSMFAR
mmetsp:Transcript_47485/g.112907  ORF Transcript_47485/g.112907 Transcript_47485/m.112907 type:complete len:209 (-) Transcript_47485:372-998(-)